MSQNNTMNNTKITGNESEINVTNISDTKSSEKPTKCYKSKKLWIIVSVVAAVVIAAVVVAIIVINKNKDKNKKIITEDTTGNNDSNSNPVRETPLTDNTETPQNPPKTNAPEPNPVNTNSPEPTPSPTPNPVNTNSPVPTPTPNPTPNPVTTTSPVPTPTPNPVTTSSPGLVPLVSEFGFNTNQNDLKSIKVVQISHDKSVINNEAITTDTTRETDYDIFILSEEDAQGEDKLYYSKMYTGAISIAKECYYTGDEVCQPKELVNISKIKEDPAKVRMLDDSVDFKNIPLATCLFNITDNDFITSITCHKDFPDMKKNEMLLDLYFFRSPAIERKNKTRDNITISINEDTKNNRRYIREQNGGLCNIHNNWGSLCTTDMNITSDLEGNLLSYDEVAITNIVYDEKNSFTKNKVSNLVDHSEKITKEDAAIYRKNLENLLAKMKPYMEEDVQFPKEKFAELYDLVKNKNQDEDSEEINEESTSKRRRLTAADAIQYIREKEIFHVDSLGVEVNLKLKLNPGLNTDAMRSHLNFSFDEEEHNLYKKEQLSEIQKIIDQLRALSKAGNIIATQLYDKISDKLENLPNEMSIQLRSLYDLLHYYDLFEVFNTTLMTISYNKLPYLVIELSTQLEIKISSIYYNLEVKGDVKVQVEELRDSVYEFVNNTHALVDTIYRNMKELGNILITKDNPFTQITNYYLNNTSVSYVKMLAKSRRVFDTYFIKEFNLTYPKIQKFLKMFEEESHDSLEGDRAYVLDMYTRLMNGSYTIVGVNEADFEKVLSNFLNTYNYTYDIIEKIKKFIMKEINIKDCSYYLSCDDINTRNKTYATLYEDAKQVIEVLNRSDLIDKTFDEIMINFKDRYNAILRYMIDKKYELFTLEEYNLKGSLFTEEVIASIKTKISEYTTIILQNMKRETEYKKEAKVIIDNFVSEHLEELDELILDLETLVSEDTLQVMANAFETSLNESLIKLMNDLDNNEKLTREYFNHFYNTIYNDSYLIEVLRNYHAEEIPKIKYISGSYKDFKTFTDEISQKERTTAYLTKYNKIVSNWNYTEKYLKNQLSQEVLEDYKRIYINIKESLQALINFDKLKNYTDLADLEFYGPHLRIIEKIQKRIDTYFSAEIFEAKYSKKVEELKTRYKEIIETGRKFIKQKHTGIVNLKVISSLVYDFCIKYERKICYGCTNCVWNTFDYGRFCIVLTPYHNNYLNLIKAAYDCIEKNKDFNDNLNYFFEQINERTTRYRQLISILESDLALAKNQTLDDSFIISNNHLSSYAEWIKTTLNTYFGQVIIKASYNHHYSQIKQKITELLVDITDRFKNLFKNLYKELNINLDNIKYTMYEFGMMGEAYQTILKTDLMTNYFNSILLFQQSEFNYTITQYYQYFYKLVNNSFTYILANLPREETDDNYIFIDRKIKTIKYFELIFNNISISQSNSTNLIYQKAILKKEETDFFEIRGKVATSILDMDDFINDKIDDIIDLELFHNSLDITQNSLTTRFYLENKEFGKLIEKIYEPIDQGDYFYLQFDKFKYMMEDNWIFDGNYFSNIIIDALYESNKEIKNDLSIKYEEYTAIIENEIKKFISNDIEIVIRQLYTENIADLQATQIANLKTLIMGILANIKEKIQKKVEKLDLQADQYYDVSLLNDTIQFYKEYIIERVNNSLSGPLSQIYEMIKKFLYDNCIENALNLYLKVARKQTLAAEYAEFSMMNSTYRIGDIVYNLTVDAVKKYKMKARKLIYFKFMEYHQKTLRTIGFIKLRNDIMDELDDIYNIVVDKLNDHNDKLSDSTKNVNYDLDISTKSDINITIDLAIMGINTIILTTKGTSFKATFKCSYNTTAYTSKVIVPIMQSLKDILYAENEEQIYKLSIHIKQTIIANLDDFLENVIPTFGNEFFDRIIDYNINFHILDIYSNLHYALGQHFLYYSALGRYTDEVTELPKDLKYRLYRLNDLNYTIENKKYEIINLLEEKLNDIIEDLKGVVETKYTLYFRENKIIKSNFSPELLQAIDNNLDEIMPNIKKIYDDALEKYLKEKFLNEFTNILNEETENMLTIFNDEQIKLKKELDFLFSEKIDEDLHAVNLNLIKTFLSIIDYYKYLRTFTFPDEITTFFRLYANVSIVPIFETFRYDLENLTFVTIYEDINNRSKSIEKIDTTEFLYKCLELMKYFETNYYIPILNALKEYNTPSYKEILFAKRDELLGKTELRRLLDKEEDAKLELERQESKDVEETFDQIYQLIVNARNYFTSCFEYYYLLSEITNDISKVNIAYKTLKPWIKENRYSLNVNAFLMTKLDKLYSILMEYYYNSNSGLSKKRFHMNYYIERIYAEILTTRLITATTLNDEYKNLLSKTENIHHTYIDTNSDIDEIEYKHETEHMINKASATFTQIREFTEFEFETFLKGGFFKTPYVKAKIVDKTRPDKMILQVRNDFGFCGRRSFRYNVDFKDVNYTLTLNYNTKSNNIDITTYTNFDKYYYTSQMYEIPDKYEIENITYFGYTISFFKQCYSKKLRNLTDVMTNEVEAKNYNETLIIVG